MSLISRPSSCHISVCLCTSPYVFSELTMFAPWCCSCCPLLFADAPKRADGNRQRTYKTKEETEKSKTVTATVVASLLIIACVVPMLQYYGYTARD